MPEKSDIPRVEVTSVEALWAWFEENHTGTSVWLATWKAATPEK